MNATCGYPLVAGERVSVEVDCGARAGVAEALLGDHDAAVFAHEECACGVPEIVKPDVWKPGPLKGGIEEALQVARV